MCEFTTATEVNLERHKESLHRNQSNKSKNNATGHEYACRKCNFKSMNENMLKEHVSSEHVLINPFACEVCDFSTTSGINLNRHKQAMHSPHNNNEKNNRDKGYINREKTKFCRFWLNGYFRNSDQQCRFIHKNPPRCKYQMDCVAWPNCWFSHDEENRRMACRYQERCRNYNCQFEHYNQQNQHFLGGSQSAPVMNMHNFPPLNPNQGQNHWMSW